MRAAYDDIVTTAVKRRHEPQRVVSDLLTAELSEKQARSIKYQIAIARLPMAKEIDEFVFDATPRQPAAALPRSPGLYVFRFPIEPQRTASRMRSVRVCSASKYPFPRRPAEEHE